MSPQDTTNRENAPASPAGGYLPWLADELARVRQKDEELRARFRTILAELVTITEAP